MKGAPDPPHRHRFPADLISHAVWPHHTFRLGFRDVELMPAERGVAGSDEAIGRRCRKVAQAFANRLRRRRPKPGDRRHLGAVVIRITGVQHDLRRAVDPAGVVLGVLVQGRRNSRAATRFLRRRLKGLRDVPRAVVTDRLKSSAAATRTVIPHVEPRQGRYRTTGAERPGRRTRVSRPASGSGA
jgi:putative transposase